MVTNLEDLMEEVLKDLSDLTEENFNHKFAQAKFKMELLREQKVKNKQKFEGFYTSNKFLKLAKLISEKYDNIVKDWTNKLNLVQKEILINQNQKKISIYNR